MSMFMQQVDVPPKHSKTSGIFLLLRVLRGTKITICEAAGRRVIRPYPTGGQRRKRMRKEKVA